MPPGKPNSRAARAAERAEHRDSNPSPWRHFWLPYAAEQKASRLEQAVLPPKPEDDIHSDSEDDTPRRSQLWCRGPGQPEPPTIEVEDEPSLAEVSDHLLAERQNVEEIAPHQCRYCEKLLIDLRRQVAEVVLRHDQPSSGEKAGTWRATTPGHETGYSFRQAEYAASEGCLLLSSLVRHAYSNLNPGPFGPLTPESTAYQERAVRVKISMRRGAEIRFSLLTNSLGELGEFFVYTMPGTKPLSDHLGRTLPPNLAPNTPLSSARARRWLEECVQGHTKCRVFNTPYMPTRMLEISGNTHIRLVANPAVAPYATLSYCWGGDQPSKTTMERLSAYRAQIPLDALPKTIREALILTQSIGLSYLWVDGLCIIQDSDQDKSQENQLSTRIIAYTDREMVYQCLESRHRDGGDDSSVAFDSAGPFGSSYPDNTLRSVLSHLDPGNRSFADFRHPLAWFRAIEAYTARELTVSDDKLPAVAAIAEEYRLTKGSELGDYLGGLWKEDFMLQCLWTASVVASEVIKPLEYRAPSWSWASVDGSVGWVDAVQFSQERNDFEVTAQFLAVRTTLHSNQEELGRVTGGFARVLARMRRIVWRNFDSTAMFASHDGRAYEDPPEKWRDTDGADKRLHLGIDMRGEWPAESEVLCGAPRFAK
ncbi:hypothetical protein QBC34DRAFT_442790 [Podospora aff. communis PSN243]|uniref:Heterokaryon incompatibility domain-containing protein n=1 Tax=Podospora aff. communis PSN243 TaxID=3040156 RepID=A0AAV9G9U6_9PEZI|nr:hypothetical protein QBC34DRAFT_442790 [Podospora aff. communis PSN243]